MLEDFLVGTASMARKRHLASSARGFLMFLSYGLTGPIRPIRLIRGRKESLSSGVLPSRQRYGGVAYIPWAVPTVTQSSALQAPERLRGNLDVFV